MKDLKRWPVALLFVLFLNGCGADVVTTTGIAAKTEAEAAKAALEAGKRTTAQLDLVLLKQAISSFKAMEGRNPASLDELVDNGYIPVLPVVPEGYEITYDSNMGKVALLKSQ